MLSFNGIKNRIVLSDSNSLRNKDLVPISVNRRTWSLFTYISFWSIMCLCMSTWTGAVSLFDMGLNGKSAIGIVIIGNLFITAATVGNSHYGSEYHIGYSVYQRIIFGIRGSLFGVLLRSLLSVVWFAAQAWLGASCVNVVLSALSKSYMEWDSKFSDGVPFSKKELVGFILFLICDLPVLLIRPEYYDWLLSSSSVLTFIACVATAGWLISINGGGHGDLVSMPNNVTETSLAWTWIYGIGSWYSSLLASITNQSDYSRFNRRPRDSMLGSIIGINIGGLVVPLVAVLGTSAFEHKYPAAERLTNPTDICAYLLQVDYSPSRRAGAFFIGIMLVFSQMTMCAVANAVPGGMDLSTLFPRYINIKRGSILVFLLVWPAQPWSYYTSGQTFINVMASFSVFLSPLLAIYVCEYFFVRRRILKLSDCYVSGESGIYWYHKGFNWRSFLSFFVCSAPGLPGLINQSNDTIDVGKMIQYYRGSFIFQFCTTTLFHAVVNMIWPPIISTRDEIDHFNTFTLKEREEWNMVLESPDDASTRSPNSESLSPESCSPLKAIN